MDGQLSKNVDGHAHHSQVIVGYVLSWYFWIKIHKSPNKQTILIPCRQRTAKLTSFTKASRTIDEIESKPVDKMTMFQSK